MNGKGLPCSGERAQDGKGLPCSGERAQEGKRGRELKRGRREDRPEIGTPGGIYGPGGAQLPAHVFYRASKERYQARVRRVDGKHHRNLADAVAEASALCGVPA